MTRRKTTRGKAALQTEVQKAVRDYLDSLISQRSGAGKGMAVSASDLLVAAKAAGQHGAKGGASDTKFDDLAQTGMRVIKETSNENQLTRSKSVPHLATTSKSQSGPVKHRSQYHWMVWKTTPTPTPPTPVPVPKSNAPDPVPIPVPVPPADSRPMSVLSVPLPPTPAAPVRIEPPTPTPIPIALNSPTPEPFRTPTFDMANIGPPNAVEIRPQPQAAVFRGAPTPNEMKADYRDILSSPQVMPTDVGVQPKRSAFEPALKAWVNNANDYDRKVAFDMFKAINGGRSISTAASVRSAAPSRISIDQNPTATTNLCAPRPPTAQSSHKEPALTAGIRTSVPMFTQKYPDLEERYMKKLQQSFDSILERSETPRPPSQQRCASVMARPHSRPQSQTYHYAMARPKSTTHCKKPRYPPRLSTPKEYIHESSFFMNSQLPFQRDFVINPEWVSEVKTRKRQIRDAQAKKAFQTSGRCHCACGAN